MLACARGDDHRGAYGVEPICKVLPIAPSPRPTGECEEFAERDVLRSSGEAGRSRQAIGKSASGRGVAVEDQPCVRAETQGLRRPQGVAPDEPRRCLCRARHSRAAQACHGAARGHPREGHPNHDAGQGCPLPARSCEPPVPRAGTEPALGLRLHPRVKPEDRLYVSTWSGFVYVAFVIDAYARRIVGWRVSRTPHVSFVLDALEQTRQSRRFGAPFRQRIAIRQHSI